MLDRKGSGWDESCASPDVLLGVAFSLPSFRFFTGVALDGTLAPNISFVMKPFPVEDGELLLLLLPGCTRPILLSTLGLRAEIEGRWRTDEGKLGLRNLVHERSTGQGTKTVPAAAAYTLHFSGDRPVPLERRGHLAFV